MLLLIQEIERKRDKKGILRKQAKYLCTFCLLEVVKFFPTNKNCKSCGCQQYSEEVKQKRRNGNIGKIVSLETRQKQSDIKKGKTRPIEVGQKVSKKLKEKYANGEIIPFWLGKPSWNKGLTKETDGRIAKIAYLNSLWIRDEDFKNKIANSLRGKFGEESRNWNNGSSFEPYSPEFNKELKQLILERDNYTCQDLKCDGQHDKLHIHHIDYNKKNNNPENLITLCNSCHMKTNSKNKRTFYTDFYNNLMNERMV